MVRFAKVAYWLLHLLILVCFLVIVISVLYFIHGSFEDFPSADDHAEARIVSMLLFNLFTLVSVVLLYIRSRLRHYIIAQAMPDKKQILRFLLRIFVIIVVPILFLSLFSFLLNYLFEIKDESSLFPCILITVVYQLSLWFTIFGLNQFRQKPE